MEEEKILEEETPKATEESPVPDEEEIDVTDQPGGALPINYMEKRFPEHFTPKEPTPSKKKHRFRNYLIAGVIVAGAAFAGDMYIQGSKTEININTNYKPGTGYSQVLDKGLDKGGELWKATKTKTADVVKLEERVTAVKGFTKYDKYKPIYQIGGIALAAGIAAYFVGSRMERRKFTKK